MNTRDACVVNREERSAEATPSAMTFGLRSNSKIQDRHRDRLAIVYVRQSTPQQVLENRESRERQYALAQFAQRLGWPAERVMIVDEDQGQSGKSADNRSGFQRLMTEVSLNHVGIVLGLELSRLSRSNTEWHHLIDVCGIFHTLLCDQDGVYDALDSNDRLLLGIKSAMSEYELITMHNRLLRGSRNKAERGELFLTVPLGYLKTPTGEVIQDRCGFRRALQRGPLTQCHRLRRTRGQAGRSRSGDLRRARSQAGCGTGKEESCSRGGSGRGLASTGQVIAWVVTRRYDEGWPGRRIRQRGRHDLSADPGTKTEGGGTMPPCLSPSGLVRKR